MSSQRGSFVSNYLQADIHGFDFPLGMHAPIHCMAYDGKRRCIAIGAGNEVILFDQLGSSEYMYYILNHASVTGINVSDLWKRTVTCKNPPSLQTSQTPAVPCSIHFLSGGKQLLVTYLEHGFV